MDCIINMFLIFKWNKFPVTSLMHRYAPIYVTQPNPFTYHIFHEPFAGRFADTLRFYINV